MLFRSQARDADRYHREVSYLRKKAPARVLFRLQFTRSRVKIWCNLFVGVAELADAADLKSADGNIVPVRSRSPAPRKAATIWWLLFFMWTIHREKQLPATDTLACPSARRAAIPVTGTKKHGILCGCRAFVMLTDYNTFQTRQGWEQQPVPGTPCACF